jgi:hypothetical protein
MTPDLAAAPTQWTPRAAGATARAALGRPARTEGPSTGAGPAEEGHEPDALPVTAAMASASQLASEPELEESRRSSTDRPSGTRAAESREAHRSRARTRMRFAFSRFPARRCSWRRRFGLTTGGRLPGQAAVAARAPELEGPALLAAGGPGETSPLSLLRLTRTEAASEGAGRLAGWIATPLPSAPLKMAVVTPAAARGATSSRAKTLGRRLRQNAFIFVRNRVAVRRCRFAPVQYRRGGGRPPLRKNRCLRLAVMAAGTETLGC